MTTMDRVRNAPTTFLTGQGLKEIAQNAQGVDDPGKALSLIGQGLQALGVKLQAADPGVDLTLTDQLARAARALSDLMAKRSSEDPGADAMAPTSISDALAASVALDSLSEGVVRAAGSIRADCGCGGSKAEARFSASVMNLKEVAAEVASEARNLADLMTDAIGLGLRDPADEMDSLSVSDCECSGRRVASRGGLVDIDSLDIGLLQRVVPADHKQLQIALTMVDGLAPRIATFLGHTGEVLCDPQIEEGEADDECTPADSLVSLKFGKASAPIDKSGSFYVPTFTVEWTLCCDDCSNVSQSENKKTVVTTTHTVSPFFRTNRRPRAAKNYAEATGRSEVKKFQASIGPKPVPFGPNKNVMPRLKKPDCPDS